uniref:BED-type domain-containing protein n=1 Tax=Chenopodium quinoa TaxID=63459 RepID=A0A803LAE6_CHEQI
METKKRKLEEDDYNNDQLNPANVDDDTGVEQQQLVVAFTSNQGLPYQLPPHFDLDPNRAPLYRPQLHFDPDFNRDTLFKPRPHYGGFDPAPQLHFGSLNQPGSSLNPTITQAPLHQSPSPRGSINQPGSSTNSAFNRVVPLHQSQSPHGSLNQPRSSLNSTFNQVVPLHQSQSQSESPHDSLNQLGLGSNSALYRVQLLHQSQPPLDSLNQPRSSPNSAFNQTSLHELHQSSQPPHGSLNQPGSSPNSDFNQAPLHDLHQSQHPHGSLNHLESSPNSACNQAPLHDLHQLQPPHVSLNQLGLSPNSAFCQAPLHDLHQPQPSDGSLNQPGSSPNYAFNQSPLHDLHQPQPPHGSLNQPGSIPNCSFNQAPLHDLHQSQHPHGSLNQPGSSPNSAFYQALLYDLHQSQYPHGLLNQPGSSTNSAFDQASLHNLHQSQPPHGSLNQPGSSPNSAFNQAPLHDLHQSQPPHSSLNQPGSSPSVSYQAPFHDLHHPQLPHGSLNQLGSSPNSEFYQAPLQDLHQSQPPHGLLNQQRLSPNSAFNQAPLHDLHQSQLPHGSLNQLVSSPNSAFDQAPLLDMHQSQPPHGSLNQPRSSPNSAFYQAPLHDLHQSQPPHGSLNQPGSSPNSTFYQAPLHDLHQSQPPRGSLNQPGLSSNFALNQAPLHQSKPPRGPLNQPGSRLNPALNQAPLHQSQPPRGSLNQPRLSSNHAFNPALLHHSQYHRGSLNQQGSRSNPVVNRAPLLQNLPPQSNEVQHNPPPPRRSNRESDSKLRLMSSQQSSNHMGNRINMMLDLVNGLKANIETLEAELYAMKQTVQPILPSTGNADSTNVHPPSAFHGGGDYRSQPQWTNADFNSRQTKRRESEDNIHKMIPSVDRFGTVISSNVLLSRAQDGGYDNAKLPYAPLAQRTGNGPGSTSGNIIAGDESEGPVSMAAGEVFSATNTDLPVTHGFTPPPAASLTPPTAASSLAPPPAMDDAIVQFATPKSEEHAIIEKPPITKKRPSIATSDGVEKKGKKKRSWLWDHFELIVKDGNKRSQCVYCKVDVCGDSRSGTSVMRNHLERCKEYPPNVDKSQRRLAFQIEQSQRILGDASVGDNASGEKEGKLEFWKFRQEEGRKAFAKMIIMDELPFRFADREGFRYFMSVVQPNFIIPSRFTVARDCYRLFLDEKKNLKSYFSKCSSRISLTIDTWTSCHNLSHMCLTAHFIDHNWNLHKKILNFCPISGHSSEAIGKAVEKCLLEWGITKVMTITVDNASSNNVGVQYLRKRLLRWKDGTVLEGKFLHMRCAAHILNLTIREGLKECDDSIKRIRNAVRFVRSSPARLQKFRNCVNQEQIESKRQLCLDAETRWNSTYLMLECALLYQKAFDLLENSDGGKFFSELTKISGVPTDMDWHRVASFIPFLKIFYDATLRLSGSLYATTNVYLVELVAIGKMIKKKCECVDIGEKLMASGMKKRHDKYWENVDNINLMLYVAVVLDPRRKMHYVKWAINDQYDSDKATQLYNMVMETLTSLYEHYAAIQSQNVPNVSENALTSKGLENYNDWHDVADYEFERDIGGQTVFDQKSDLDKYLMDDREPNIIVSLHQSQPPRSSLNQPGLSSNPAFNQTLLHQLQYHRGFLNQPGSRSNPVVNRSPLCQFLPPWSNEGQHNPFPPRRSNQESATKFRLMSSQQSSNHMGDRINMMLDLVNGLKANVETLEAELYAMKQTVQPISPSTGEVGSTNVLPPGAFQVSSSNVLLSESSRCGPGSALGYTTAKDESEGLVSTAAGEVFSATDTGEEENADTSQDGNTQGNSSAQQSFRR